MPGKNLGLKGWAVGAAIGKHLRVKIVSGQLAVAALADMELGTITQASFAAGDVRTVECRNLSGTRLMVANGALNIGDNVYTAAAGKVGAAATGAFREGIALSATTADGDYVEVATDPGETAHA